jgi:hypothetical protein
MSTKKDKNNRELTQEKIKAIKEAHLKEAAEYKQRVKPLVDFLRSSNIRFSHAQVGNERVEYFRLDEFDKLLKEKAETIEKNEELSKLAKNSSAEFVFFRRPEGVKIKYPKTLEPVLPASADKKYASFRFDTT